MLIIFLTILLFSVRTGQNAKTLYKELEFHMNNPTEGVRFAIDGDDLSSWYFVFTGEKGTVYEGGQYFGKLSNYYPPENKFAVQMYTPSGRFKTGQNICIENTKIYQIETYGKRWNAASIIVGIKQIMKEDGNEGSVHIQSTNIKRKELAKASSNWNRRDSLYNTIFPVDPFPAIDTKTKSFFKKLFRIENRVDRK